MIPRGTPDMGWLDLLAGLAGCLRLGNGRPANIHAASVSAEQAFAADEACLATLSVRSGLDLLCQVMAWPRGSEVIVSAITIRDMTRVLEHHGLVPVPVDISPVTLAVDPGDIAMLITPRTKAILVAHLFGSRMPLEGIADVAEQHGLLLIEDAAQAFAGDSFRGHPRSDLSLFSFGPIKTQTALGGAVLRFRDPAVRDRLKALQAGYPLQSRRRFARRLLLFILLKGLTCRPTFTCFAFTCRLFGIHYDQFLQSLVRGFPGGDLIDRLRHQPHAAQLRLLARRLRQSCGEKVARRVRYAEKVTKQLPEAMRVGAQATDHTHWVLPIVANDPEQLVHRLVQSGFDATCRASSMHSVEPPSEADSTPVNSQLLMNKVVYLPMFPGMRPAETQRLASLVTQSN